MSNNAGNGQGNGHADTPAADERQDLHAKPLTDREPFTLPLEQLAELIWNALRERHRDLVSSHVTDYPHLSVAEQQAYMNASAAVAQEVVRAFLDQAAGFAPNDWAARYTALLALVGNMRLVINVETFVATAIRAHQVSGAPVSLLLARMFYFVALLNFNRDDVLYPNHAVTCGVNNLTRFAPCNCGEAERLVAMAAAQAATPAMTDDELHDLFAYVAQGVGGHGGFVVAFAKAFVTADRDNQTLMRGAALTLVDRYNLRASVAEALKQGGA
jgi:hypothetical protein